MGRVAVFVDSGYLYAQGSTALTGSKKPRSDLRLNETLVLEEFIAVARTKAPDASLLRVYWYDGAVNYRGPTLAQTTLANLDSVKLRLGFVNTYGQQKGVDSLIVTDLIDLARNRAISDAVLLSGDEDVRIGVQIAQTFGVRLHLLGIEPSRGSQSRQLLQEADTTTEWDKATVAKFLTYSAPEIAAPAAVVATSPEQPADTPPELDTVATTYAAAIDDSEVANLKTLWRTSGGIPPEFDGRLLARCRAELGRSLTLDERHQIRAKFKACVAARAI